MLCYGLYQFGIKEVTTDLPGVSVLIVASFGILVAPVAYVLTTNEPVTASFLSIGPWLLGLLAGIGFVFLYLAIERGPISIIAPIYGLYMLVPSILGITILNENLTITKTFGITFALLAVILLTR